MKKLLYSVWVGLMCLIGIGLSPCLAQQATPDLAVSLALNKPAYLLNSPTDPISITLTVKNVGASQIITSAGFQEKPFHLFLTFVDPDGKGIAANELEAEGHEGPMPRVLLVNDAFVQVEAVEILPTTFTATVTIPNASAYYTFTKSGRYSVRAIIAIRTYQSVFQTVDEVNFAQLSAFAFAGVLESNVVDFSLIGDVDGDHYAFPQADARISSFSVPDCDDRPNGADGIAGTADDGSNIHPGATEIIGNGIDDDCNPATPDTLDTLTLPPATLIIQASKHTVGGDNHPVTRKEPISGLIVRVFNTAAGSCAKNFGLSWQHHKSIWLSCLSQKDGVTDSTGTVTLQVAPGSYFALSELNPDTIPLNGDEIYTGVNVGGVGSGETVRKLLQIIVKADGGTVPGKTTKKTGSELLIIEPEYIEWDGKEELYPFIFESVSDWTIITAVEPPEGFVAEPKSLATRVDTDLEAVQFTVADMGSVWVSTKVTHRLTHKGKSEIVHSQIGVKLSERLARQKGLDRFGRPKGR